MKKIVSILVVMAMLISMVPAVFADDSDIGTYYNPEVITEPGDYTANVPEGWNGYYYSYTAETSGAVIFTINESDNWIYWIYNASTEEQAYMYSSDGASPSYTMTVAEGDTVMYNLLKEDCTAGTISFSVEKVDFYVEKVVLLSADDWTLPCESAEIPAGGSVKYKVTNGMDGGMLTVTGENAYVEIEGTTLYPDEEGVIYIDFNDYAGEPEYNMWGGVTYSYIMYIGNSGSEAAVFMLGSSYPAGTGSNPAVIEADKTSTVELPADDSGNYGGYYFRFYVPEDAIVTVTVESDDAWFFSVRNDTTYEYGDSLTAVTGDTNTQSIVAHAGDVIIINVNTLDENYTCPGGTVSVTVTYEAIEIIPGGIYDPYYISAYSCPTYTEEIPAGGYYYYELSGFSGNQLQITGENAYLIMDDVTYTPDENGVILVDVVDYPTVIIGNSGSEAASFLVERIYPLGSYYNPQEITLDTPYTVDRAANASYYYFTWTAEETGTFTATMLSESGWRYYIQNSSTWKSTSTHTSMDETLVPSDSITVEAGDKVTVYVSTYDGNYNTPEGQFSVSFSFEKSNVDGFLSMGYNYKELTEGDTDGCTWTYTATESGILDISVMSMTMYDVFGEMFSATEDEIDAYFSRNSFTLLVNGVDTDTASQRIEVTEGDVVTVQLSSAKAVWCEALIYLSMYVAPDEVEIALGENTIFIGSNGVSATFVPSVSGTLTLEATTVGTYDDWFDSWSYLFDTDLPYAFWMLGLTIDGVSYEANPVSIEVEAGVPVTIEMCDIYGREDMVVMNVTLESAEEATVIESLPADLTVSLTDENCELGLNYQYTAEKDGIILISAPEGVDVIASVNGEFVIASEGIQVSAGDVVLMNIYSFAAGDYSVCIAYELGELGSYSNPDVLNYYEMLGEVYIGSAQIAEGSEDGYWWSMTAAENGVAYFIASASLADGEPTDSFCLFIYINGEFYTNYSFNGVSDTVVTLPVSEGDEIMINVCAYDGEALSVYTNAFIVDGTIEDPVYIKTDYYQQLPVAAGSSLAFVDSTIDAHWSSSGLVISCEDADIMASTTVSIYVDGELTETYTADDDGVIYVDAPAGCVIVVENGADYVAYYDIVANTTAGILGDVNGDGLVDSDDAALILKYDVGLIDGSEMMLDVADVNGDGLVDSDDAALILKYDVGLIEGF